MIILSLHNRHYWRILLSALAALVLAPRALLVAQNQPEVFISPLANRYLERMIAVRRLEPALKVIKGIECSQGIGLSVEGLNEAQSLISHPTVASCLEQMIEKSDLSPLHQAWDHFFNCRSLESKDFERDMVTVLLLLVKNYLLSALRAKKYQFPGAWKRKGSKIPFTCEEIRNKSRNEARLGSMYELLDQYCDRIEWLNGSRGPMISTKAEASMRFLLPPDEKLDHIHFRFYLISRIECPIALLEQLSTAGTISLRSLSEKEKGQIPTLTATVTDLQILNCIKQMNDTLRFRPLFDLWRNATRSSSENSGSMLRDIIRILVSVYSAFMAVQHPAQQSNISIADILEAYDQLASSPLFDLLHELDGSVDELLIVLEEEENSFLGKLARWKQSVVSQWWFRFATAGGLTWLLIKYKKSFPSLNIL